MQTQVTVQCLAATDWEGFSKHDWQPTLAAVEGGVVPKASVETAIYQGEGPQVAPGKQGRCKCID